MLMMKREGQKIQKRYLLYGKWQEEVIGYWLLVVGGEFSYTFSLIAERILKKQCSSVCLKR